MRIHHFIVALLPVLFLSCQKEFSIEQVSTGSGTDSSASEGLLVKIYKGTPGDDTTFLIQYDSLQRIRLITYGADTVLTEYDEHNHLVRVKLRNSGEVWRSANFSYDDAGLLVQVDYAISDVIYREGLEYNNGVIAKRNYWGTDVRSQELKYLAYDIYEITGGNITKRKKYLPDGTFAGEVSFYYGTQPNPFQKLALFDCFTRTLTLEGILQQFEIAASQNICTGYTYDDNSGYKITYTFDNKNRPLTAVATATPSVYHIPGLPLAEYHHIFTYNK
jgi:hypothetical protein